MKYLKGVIVGVIALFFVVGVAVATTYTYNYYWDIQADHGVFFYTCIPRAGASGGNWFCLDNDTHKPVGISGVTTYSDHIQINLANEYDKVVYASCSYDEAYAGTVHPGVQMALGYWTVILRDSSGNVIDPTTLTSSGSHASDNLWCIAVGTD